MAETAKGFGRLLAGDQFEFTLDGLASAAQMDKLINSISGSLGGAGSNVAGGAKATIRKNTELNKKWQESLSDATKAVENSEEALKTETKRRDLLNKELNKFKGALHSVGRGSLTGALESLDSNGSRFALGLGALVGSLTGYADKLTEGLQRGISGGIFDYAIAAKTAGIRIEDFSKAISETSGSFASLGTGATDGAKQFGFLIGNVREATASVGNLGMTNEQLAMFTAQQTKTAISQGFKGKAAQDVVIKNSRALGDELDTLANRTGKSVLELAQAAMKLAQDPIVANFVQTAKFGGEQVSKAVQQFGASLRGVFGEAGDAVAADTLKSALGGLPLVITQTGKNMIMASSAVYSELERQANIVKRGGDITVEDQEKLRNTVIKEVEARGAELRMLANLEGPMGESAKQLLALAEQANFYNSEAGAQRREDDKTAQQFNKSIRELQANVQKLLIPFLTAINTINWGAFVSVLSAFADIVRIAISPLTGLAELLGSGTTAGTVVGGLFGLVAVAGLLVAAQTTFIRVTGLATAALAKLAGTANLPTSGKGYDIGTKAGRGAAGLITSGAGTGLLASGAATQIAGAPQTGIGTAGNLAGGIGGGILGQVGGAALGRIVGGTLGSFLGPIGAVVVGSAGAALGQWIGDKIGGASSDLASVGSDAIESRNKIAEASLSEQQKTNKLVAEMANGTNATAVFSSRQVALANDTNRAIRNQQWSMG